MELAVVAPIVLAVGALVALRFDALRHRAAGLVVGATFGVFGLVGLLGALFVLLLPAYRRAQLRREQARREPPEVAARAGPLDPR